MFIPGGFSANEEPCDTLPGHPGPAHDGANIALGKRMEAPVKYKILKGSTDHELEEEVKKHLREGWRPLGGVSIIQAEMAFSKVLKFYQAVEMETREDRRRRLELDAEAQERFAEERRIR